MKKLFKVWKVVSGIPPTMKFYARWAEIDHEKHTLAYPLVEIISSLPGWYSREDMVSTDRGKLERLTEYLNRLADANEHYEIREVDPKEFEHLF